MNLEGVHVHAEITDLPYLETTLESLYFKATQATRNRIIRMSMSYSILCNLPPCFASMFPNVTVLSLGRNKFNTVPAVIYAMTRLREVNITYCNITRIPSRMSRLINLSSLSILAGNPIEALFQMRPSSPAQARLLEYSTYYAAVEQRERHAVAAVVRYLRARSAPDIARMIGKMIWRAYQSGQCVLNDKK